MTDLIERLERAAEGSWELDAEVHCALGSRLEIVPPPCRYPKLRRWTNAAGESEGWREGAAEWPPHYTASVDAAMALMPAAIPQDTGVFWSLGNDGEGGDPALFKAQILMCSLFTSRSFEGWGDTPALAMCSAALRARQQKDTVV